MDLCLIDRTRTWFCYLDLMEGLVKLMIALTCKSIKVLGGSKGDCFLVWDIAEYHF